MPDTVLTIAAHPDDEILGCGGTMARHAAEGDEVHILILAEGLTSRDEKRNRDAREGELQGLGRAANLAAQTIGARSCELLDFADNRMDGVALLDVVKAIEKKIDSVRPSVIYTHFPHDLNVDHRITSQAVMTACRPVPGQIVREIYFFEVVSSTEWSVGGAGFLPGIFVSLSGRTENEYLAKKLEALEAYVGEMRPFPHARSIHSARALAEVRGASVGVPSAEAFVLGRLLV